MVHLALGAEGAGEGEAAAEEEAERQARRREHLELALHALRNVLEAQPRLSALMASRPALAPLLACIEPICRSVMFPGLPRHLGHL